jgi:pimeloyl-ACP methyl ester carboxylesterase
VNSGSRSPRRESKHEYIAEPGGQLEERANASDHCKRSGVRVRELGTNNPGIPVVFLTHLAAVLDNWDPRVVDGFAASRHVITFDNRGIGASSGTPATSIEEMARDAITFIKAMRFEQVDLFGFSMGGMRAHAFTREADTPVPLGVSARKRAVCRLYGRLRLRRALGCSVASQPRVRREIQPAVPAVARGRLASSTRSTSRLGYRRSD